VASAALGSAPAVAREVDPELPAHWTALLALLGRHDAAHGPREVLTIVERELRVIAEHRGTARGELRAQLMRVEARWSQLQERDAPRSVALAEDALRVPGASAQASAYCTLQAACGYALAHDAETCERSLAAARTLVEHPDPSVLPWASGFPVAAVYVRAIEARCWLSMRPRKAVSLYDRAQREWPRDGLRTGGVHQAVGAGVRRCRRAGPGAR
jgi:hypothetical protein